MYNKLDPCYSAHKAYGVKGNRQTVVLTNDPSKISAKEILTVRFPDRSVNELIIPGTVRLSFNIELNGGTDNNRTVNNLGRVIVSKITIIMCLDNADIYMCYCDLWMTEKKRKNAAYYSIHVGDGRNTAEIRLGAADAVPAAEPDATIAALFGNLFAIPLDFEILTDHGPFYQAGLRDRLTFELIFNKPSNVIISTDDAATYKISGIALEFDTVENPELAQRKRQQLMNQTVFLYTQIVFHEMMLFDKSNTTWTINMHAKACSLKGILLLFEDPAVGAMGPDFGRNSEFYYNPLIMEVKITVDGKLNQLYENGVLPYHHWDEIVKEFAREEHKSIESPSTELSTYIRNRYALWLDRKLPGRQVMSSLSLQLTKLAQAAGRLNCDVYLPKDAQLNISEGRMMSVVY